MAGENPLVAQAPAGLDVLHPDFPAARPHTLRGESPHAS